MVAQVLKKEKKYAVLTKEGTVFVWDYKLKDKVEIKKENIPAISICNNPNDIDNKQAICFPKNFEDVAPIEKPKSESENNEKITNLGRREQSEQLQESTFEGFSTDDTDDDQSILIQKLRELIIRFEKLLAKYLDPDIPKGRADRKKFDRERKIFRTTGYKDFINSIDLKVDALCNFEDYDLDQFCIHPQGKCQVNWFKSKISQALKDDFYSAQEIVNSVMQIVKEEEYAVPRRRVVTKLR